MSLLMTVSTVLFLSFPLIFLTGTFRLLIYHCLLYLVLGSFKFLRRVVSIGLQILLQHWFTYSHEACTIITFAEAGQKFLTAFAYIHVIISSKFCLSYNVFFFHGENQHTRKSMINILSHLTIRCTTVVKKPTKRPILGSVNCVS